MPRASTLATLPAELGHGQLQTGGRRSGSGGRVLVCVGVWHSHRAPRLKSAPVGAPLFLAWKELGWPPSLPTVNARFLQPSPCQSPACRQAIAELAPAAKAHDCVLPTAPKSVQPTRWANAEQIM